MSTAKKLVNKTEQAAREALRKAYPYVPPALMPHLDRVMRHTDCREVAQSIERLFELALFKAGAHEGLDENDCNSLVDAHALMKAFRESATQQPDH